MSLVYSSSLEPFEMNVGSVDIQTPSLLARIYYPTATRGQSNSWLPRASMYAKGLMHFLKLPSVIYPLIYLKLKSTRSTASLFGSLSNAHPTYPVGTIVSMS